MYFLNARDNIVMKVHIKSCPHCKNGDLTEEYFSDKAIGNMYFLKCLQCGWDKDITNEVKAGVYTISK